MAYAQLSDWLAKCVLTPAEFGCLKPAYDDSPKVLFKSARWDFMILGIFNSKLLI